MTLRNCNPIAASLCFLELLLISMFVSNPIIQVISLFGAVAFCAFLTDVKDLFNSISMCFIIFCLITGINPLFSHNGVTTLYYLNGNPVTLEAYLYGAGAGIMISSVFMWCKALSIVLTADRMVYLFGRLTPKTALVLSVAIRYIPMLKRRGKRISEAQRALGLRSSDGYFDRLRSALHTFSALVGWSLESAVETANAMQARGYGSKKHTTYSDIRFTLRDGLLTAVLIGLFGFVIAMTYADFLDFSYYPAIMFRKFSFQTLTALLVFAVLVFLPTIFEIKECIKWKRLKSKI